MKLESISQQEVQRELGLVPDADGLPPQAGLARLVRLAVERWSVTTPAKLRHYVWTQLDAVGLLGPDARSRLNEVIERLVLLRDLDRVTIDGREHLARTLPRWIELSDTTAALTGTLPDVPPGLDLLEPCEVDPLDVLVRRFDPRPDEVQALLLEHSIEEWSLGDWTGVPAYHRSLRRLGKRSGVMKAGLADLWLRLCKQLSREGLSVGADADIRVLGGAPGEFFGSGRKAQPSGRWQTPGEDGLWVGVRRGYSEHHWHSCLVEVEGGQAVRLLDLFDLDEARWAILARGHAEGLAEVVRLQDGELELTTDPPEQARRLLVLLGHHQGGWRWQLVGDPQPLVELLELG